jgi:NADH-quinone oxidoreductase subunit D
LISFGYNHAALTKDARKGSFRTLFAGTYRASVLIPIPALMSSGDEIAAWLARRALYIRTLIGEQERVHSHFLWWVWAGHEIGFDTLLCIRARCEIVRIFWPVTGNRVNYGIKRSEACGAISARNSKDILGHGDLEERTKYYSDRHEERHHQAAFGSGLFPRRMRSAWRRRAYGGASGVDRDIPRQDLMRPKRSGFLRHTDCIATVYGAPSCV